MSAINFFAEEVEFDLKAEDEHCQWLYTVAEQEGYQIKELNYIFCSDEYLLKINQQYLNHDTYTDIITFDNSEEEAGLESDIFISIERIIDNAGTMNTSFDEELRRVMVHGLLHLMGYADKSETDKTIMRDKEDSCISLYSK